MIISKSKYIEYKQCEKKIWLDTYCSELADEFDQTVFVNGNKVGEIARVYLKGGTLVEYNKHDKNNIDNMVKKTKNLIKSGCKIIYEAAFLHGSNLAICDILVVKNFGFDIYEVKSSTGVREVYIDDAAFQYYVIKSLGYNINKINIMHINNQYVRNGELDISLLFEIDDVTSMVKLKQKHISKDIKSIKELLLKKDEPRVALGLQCTNPYLCQFKGYCYKYIPNNSVFDIKNLSLKKKFELYDSNIVTFDDIRKSNIELSYKQEMQVNTQLDGKDIIELDSIKDFLSQLFYPLYFLDFETFSLPIPPFNFTKPFQQIPSQYSLHYIEKELGELNHLEFLADEKDDPRYELAKRLVKDIPDNVCVLAYNMSFEKRVIRELANLFPDLREHLVKIHNNVYDLMIPFQKKHLYIKGMKGSYSIKYVLPALFKDSKELSYDNLDGISNGQEAANAYATLTDYNEDEKEKIRKSLLAYCKLDTLAMVKIWEYLVGLVTKGE